MEIANADGARIAALAQLAPPLRIASFPLSGHVRLATDGSTINVERFALDFAGVALRGQMGIAPEGKGQRVNARIEADELSLAQLAMPMLDTRLGSATAVAEAAIAERGSIWPPQPFDQGIFSGLVGDVQLGAKRLVVFRRDGLVRCADERERERRPGHRTRDRRRGSRWRLVDVVHAGP